MPMRGYAVGLNQWMLVDNVGSSFVATEPTRKHSTGLQRQNVALVTLPAEQRSWRVSRFLLKSRR